MVASLWKINSNSILIVPSDYTIEDAFIALIIHLKLVFIDFVNTFEWVAMIHSTKIDWTLIWSLSALIISNMTVAWPV